MRYFEYVREAFSALLRNKMRSFLTLLGMVIGVAAVDAVYGLSVGAANAIDSSISSGQDPSLWIYVDPKQANPDAAALSYRDAALVAADLGDAAKRVIPFYNAYISNVGRYYNVHSGTQKVGALGFSWYADDPNLKLLAGSGFSSDEVTSAARVSLISQDLATHFFGNPQAAVGAMLLINGSRYRIVGVPDPNAGSASKNYFGGSYYFLLPYTTFHDLAPGQTDSLLVWTSSPDMEDTATSGVRATLAHVHGPRSKYQVTSIREQLQQQQKVISVIAISLTAIGAISLLVAGIGIMNIMLVAVTERTREIGIRKSIGAHAGEIVLQFIVEAVFLSLVGGVIGLLLSCGVILLVRALMEHNFGDFTVPWATVVLYAFVFSFVVGLVFGVYPAARASRLDPIEALRS